MFSDDKTSTNSVALVRKRTIPSKRPPFVGDGKTSIYCNFHPIFLTIRGMRNNITNKIKTI
jgi:hypothetical protein